MRSVFLSLAVVAAMMFGGAAAQAGFITGGVSFSGDPANSSSGNILDARNVTNVTKTSGFMDFSSPGIPNLTTLWGNFSITTPMPALGFSMTNSLFGTFTSTGLTSDTNNVFSGNGSRTIVMTGSFTAGLQFAAGLRDATLSNLTITLNQTSFGAVTSFSTTMDMVASGTGISAVPEPSSIAIFGLGALGMVARRFRRK